MTVGLILAGRSTWWARLDLNQEPTDYESAALTVELRARPANILQIHHGPRLFADFNWRASAAGSESRE